MVSLETTKLFGQLPAAELARLRAVTRELQFPGGRQIFKEGDPGDGLYVVSDGRVQISASIETGKSRVISEAGPGDIFGEMAVLDDQPRSACASTAGETSVLFIPRDPLRELIRASPDFALRLIQEISTRLREFNRQYIREVLQAERMALVGRFASSIVHDLKNPLTIISVGAEMAGAATATPAVRKTAQSRITRQVERITHLVNDILEFTRGTSSNEAFVSADFGWFIKNLMEELQAEVGLKAVNIVFEKEPPSVPIALHPQRLSRVFYNLVTNATDMMPEGGRISLHVTATDDAVVTEVKDTGPGIAPEIAERLFEPFATFGKPRGTGLGLSISKRIVEEHRGTITGRNAPEGGAVFTVRLPRERPR